MQRKTSYNNDFFLKKLLEKSRGWLSLQSFLKGMEA